MLENFARYENGFRLSENENVTHVGGDLSISIFCHVSDYRGLSYRGRDHDDGGRRG